MAASTDLCSGLGLPDAMSWICPWVVVFFLPFGNGRRFLQARGFNCVFSSRAIFDNLARDVGENLFRGRLRSRCVRS